MVGLFEPVLRAVEGRTGSRTTSRSARSPPDWDRMGPYLEKAMARVPVTLGRRASASSSAAPRASRPTCAGRRRGARGAQLLRRRRAELDRHPHRRRARPRRWRTGSSTAAPTSTSPASTSTACTATRPTPSTARTRTVESLGMVYKCHYPTQVACRPRAARSARPLHDRLAARGAYFRDVSGWEGADWYAGRGPRRRPRPAHVGPADVVRAVGRPSTTPRARASIVHGHVVHGEVPRAGPRRRAGCSTSCRPTHVDGDAGMITYTQWLNEGGTLEADLTVTKLDDDALLGRRVRHRAPPRADVDAAAHRRRTRTPSVTDVTSALRADQRAGAAVARAAAVAHDGRPVERRVPVPRRARDRHRLRAGAVRAHHLPRRARLRAVRARRAGDARLRPRSSPRARRTGCGTPG